MDCRAMRGASLSGFPLKVADEDKQPDSTDDAQTQVPCWLVLNIEPHEPTSDGRLGDNIIAKIRESSKNLNS